MIPSPCNVGVAFYSVAGFPPQWVLMLSEHQLFEGNVSCGTAIQSVNGWKESVTTCAPSLARFNPMGVFSGVVYIACSAAPMERLKESISKYKIASEAARFAVPVHGDKNLDAVDTPERYVIRLLLLLNKEHSLQLPTLDPPALANLIRGRLPVLGEPRWTSDEHYFPVFSLTTRTPSFGRLHPSL